MVCSVTTSLVAALAYPGSHRSSRPLVNRSLLPKLDIAYFIVLVVFGIVVVDWINLE